jgi:protein TonB
LGWRILASDANRVAVTALLENIRQVFIARKTPAKEAPPTAANQPFQVEVTDLQNRRSMLNIKGPKSDAPKSASPEVIPGPASQKKNAPSSADSPDHHASVASRNEPIPQISASTGKARPDDQGTRTSNASAPQMPATPAAASPANRLPPAVIETPLAASPADSDALVQPAALISSVLPVYPPAAKASKIEGDVIVDAIIDKAGRVTGMKVISGPNPLRPAAMDSFRRWSYEPALLRGQAIPSRIQVTIKFRLE